MIQVPECKYLFLLCGTNPLPNFVAAKVLAPSSGGVYVVHTIDTARVADRLRASLGNEGFHCVPVEVDEADAADISFKIERVARSIDSGRVGLNYTGGTKVMAVHAYRAIERALGSHQPPPLFTYLDAGRLELRVDPYGSAAAHSLRVGLALRVDLKTLAALHGSPLRFDPTGEPTLADIAAVLASAHAERAFVRDWRLWCERELRDSDLPWKFKRESALRTVTLPEGFPLGQVADAFRKALSLASIPITIQEAARAAGFKQGEDLAKWLDGKWLEHHTLDAVKVVAERCQLQDLGMNLEIAGEHEFEIDVAAMRGYQLFAISCTTEEKVGQCKLKLFEAHVRARQLGGDESRVCLVCCYPDPLRLQSEIMSSWDAEGRVRVFGPGDLRELPDKLSAWFNSDGG